jgi:hypothetical protein
MRELNDPGRNGLYIMFCGCGPFEIWRQRCTKTKVSKNQNKHIVNTGVRHSPSGHGTVHSRSGDEKTKIQARFGTKFLHVVIFHGSENVVASQKFPEQESRQVIHKNDKYYHGPGT